MAAKAKIVNTKTEKRRTEIIVSSRGEAYSTLMKAVSLGAEARSKQLVIEAEYLQQNGLIDLPFGTDALLIFYEANSVFYACVTQIAKDVAGSGWTLQKTEDAEEDQAEYRRAKEFLESACEGSSITIRGLVVELIVDWGTIGNYYIEIVRNPSGNVSKLYRIPAQTMRVHKDKKKYCQTRNEKHVWFEKFGEVGDISCQTGEPLEVGEAADIATEVIHYHAPYPRSDYYGAPNIIAAIGDIVGLIGCRDYNLAFFDNFGLPAAIITLTGDWDEGAEQKIRNFLKTEIRGPDNAHKSLVLSQSEDTCKVEIKPLDPNPIKDLSFDKYEKTRKENILIAYSMPPERVGMRVVGQLGGNVAEESTKVYIQGVIEPLQQDMEAVFNLILKIGLGVTKYRMKFKALDLRNMSAIAERQSRQIEHGILSPNDARNELGLKTYEGGDTKYIMANLLPVSQDAEPVPDDKITVSNKQLEKCFDEHSHC